jgi:hypothetical protein
MSNAQTKAILADIKTFLDGNDKTTKKDFLKAVGEAFDKNKTAKPKTLKLKGKQQAEVKDDKEEKVFGGRKVKKVEKDDIHPEDKPKRKLSDYQQFAKDQLAYLKQREDAKEDREEKLKQKDLMKLVGKRWKLKKEDIDESEWDERMMEDDE